MSQDKLEFDDIDSLDDMDIIIDLKCESSEINELVEIIKKQILELNLTPENIYEMSHLIDNNDSTTDNRWIVLHLEHLNDLMWDTHLNLFLRIILFLSGYKFGRVVTDEIISYLPDNHNEITNDVHMKIYKIWTDLNIWGKTINSIYQRAFIKKYGFIFA